MYGEAWAIQTCWIGREQWLIIDYALNFMIEKKIS